MTPSLLDRAISFATSAHSGQFRKGSNIPYIVHPLEAMAIVATVSDNQELLAAAVLHDVVEDTPASIDDIRQEFGDHVAALVLSDSNPPRRPGDTWRSRKQAAADRLAAAPRDAQLVALGDKLSNLRAIHRDFQALGDTLWQRFKASGGQSDIAWYYHALASALAPLAGTPPYDEFAALLPLTFPKTDS